MEKSGKCNSSFEKAGKVIRGGFPLEGEIFTIATTLKVTKEMIAYVHPT